MPHKLPAGLSLLLVLLLTSPAQAYLSLVRQGAESSDVPNTDDRFGATVCTGDFDGDGLDDLATAAPDESNGLINTAVHGLVVISYGTSRGIGHLGAHDIHPGDLGIEAARFGRSLAAADFDQDGYDDLAVGIPQLDNFGGPDRGAVWVYRGSASGLENSPYRQISYDAVEISPQDYANFGWALTAGDFNDDSYPDLATSAIGQNSDTGVLYFFYGGAVNGITTVGFDKMFPYTAGGSQAAGSRFGWALASGQLDGLGGDDLVVGAPKTDVLGQADAGRVYFYYAGASGISGTGAWFLDASNMMAVATEGNAELGFSLAVGNFFQVGGQADVAVGAPKDDYGDQGDAGSVILVEFDSLPTSYDSLRKLRQHGIYDATDASPGDQFGYALAAGRYDIGNYEDLAIGAPYEDVTEQAVLGQQFNAGTFHIVYGGASGPSMSNSETYNSIDLNNFVDGGDNLGFALAFGRFDSTSREGLAIGAPNADYDSYESGGTNINDAGQVHIFAPWRQVQGHPHRSSVALDCDGFIIYAQRPFQRVRPASTTKTVTLALACDAIFDDDIDPFQFFLVPDWVDEGPGGSLTPLVAGEQLSFVGLMQTMMTVSGNDSAMLIGALLSGDGGPWEGWSDTSPAFATMMETKLDQLGLSAATSMTNAAGIDSGDHYVTALDWVTLARQVITNSCVLQIVDTSPWIVERIQPAGTSLGFFAVPGDGGGDIHIFEAFFASWVDGVKGGYSEAVGIKPGGTPGAWRTGLSAADPFGTGYSVASSFGTRTDDAPVEGVAQGSSTALHADLLALAETYCDDGEPDDVFLPPSDPEPKPWGTLTGIPPCPDQGPQGMTMNLIDEQIVTPGRTVQIDLMRHTLIEPSIPVRQLIRRNSEILLSPGQIVPLGVAPHRSNQGLQIRNVGTTPAVFEVLWGGGPTLVELAPGAKTTIGGVSAPGSSFNGSILSTASIVATLELIELGYEFDMVLGDGVSGPDAHTVQLTRAGDLLSESVSVYVRGLDDSCGDDTLDLVARADDDVPTAVDEPLPLRPTAFQLLPAVPNPFNPSTTLSFDLPRAAAIELAIYDVRGRLVKTLQSGETWPAGRHRVQWDGTDGSGRRVASGVYLVRLASEGQQQTQRMTLIK